MTKLSDQQYFTRQLLAWFDPAARPLPWKGERDPYLIWLSEIILQQTRVEQGMPYFLDFAKAYPSVRDLAAAPEDEVMRRWQGLGYYSRARNLHFTAKHITNELGGVFPKDYSVIRALKGVGDYTAAAIASFAYELPHAVVDGNVYRVLSRYFGIKTPIDTTAGKKEFATLAAKLLDPQQPAQYNQAIMDFGATLCTPAQPNCDTCPLVARCVAKKADAIVDYPVKSKKLIKRNRWFHYLVLRSAAGLWISKRTERDIWQNLYELPNVEAKNGRFGIEHLRESELWTNLLGNYSVNLIGKSSPMRQILTHQRILATFWEIETPTGIQLPAPYVFATTEQLDDFGFPRVIDLYLKQKSLTLEMF